MRWVESGGLMGSSTESKPEMSVVSIKQQFVMVLSHDCEFNEGKRHYFMVGRIDGFPGKISEEQLLLVQAGNDIATAIKKELKIPLDVFYLEPLGGVFDKPQYVNFGAATFMSMDFTKEALAQKRAELLHEHRVLLRTKLGYFFGRPADDIPDEEKKPPPKAEPAAPSPVKEAS
jgi:hypothetical protein